MGGMVKRLEKVKFPKNVMKLPLFGDAGVGKSSLAKQLCENDFSSDYDATRGSSFFSKKITIKEQQIKALIFDLGGQKRFFSLDKDYWNGANCALAIFDLTRQKTFQTLKGWLEEFREENPDAPVLIAGNKKDLDDLRAVSKKEGKQLAENYNTNYMEISAKTGEGVKNVFKKVMKMGITNKLPVR